MSTIFLSQKIPPAINNTPAKMAILPVGYSINGIR